eukprot:g11697.t1
MLGALFPIAAVAATNFDLSKKASQAEARELRQQTAALKEEANALKKAQKTTAKKVETLAQKFTHLGKRTQRQKARTATDLLKTMTMRQKNSPVAVIGEAAPNSLAAVKKRRQRNTLELGTGGAGGGRDKGRTEEETLGRWKKSRAW